MGTALKILFSESPMTGSVEADALPFRLSRVEIVSLFNAFGR